MNVGWTEKLSEDLENCVIPNFAQAFDSLLIDQIGKWRFSYTI